MPVFLRTGRSHFEKGAAEAFGAAELNHGDPSVFAHPEKPEIVAHIPLMWSSIFAFMT